MRKFLIFMMTLLPIAAIAQAKGKNAEQLLLDLTKRYRDAKVVRMDMERTVSSELTETKTVYKGEIILSGEKFRLDQKNPERNLVIYDGAVLMTVQYPPEEFHGATVQVTKQKMKKGDGNAVLTSLLTQGKVTDRFQILTSNKIGNIANYELKPKSDSLNVTKVRLKIEIEKSLVRELTFWDELGNESHFLFPQVIFSEHLRAGQFKYNPPKDAEVIQL